MNNPKIVLLAGKGMSTNVLFHALKNNIDIDTIILEERVNTKDFIKKRIKKLGIWKVFGQILFQLFIVNLLNLIAAKRKKEIFDQYGLDQSDLPPQKLIRVNSVNDNSCINILKELNPTIVIVNGTRIISTAVLECTSSLFINLHAGITPKYRGVHGAYWALVNNDATNCGVTIHCVDKGIDTGAIISQKTIPFTRKDNFVTYPLLQIATGIPLMQKAIEDTLNSQLVSVATTGESGLWTHPTIWQYLSHYIRQGKK